LVVCCGCTTNRSAAWRVITDPAGATVSDTTTGKYIGETTTDIITSRKKVKRPLIGRAEVVEDIKTLHIEKRDFKPETKRLTLTYEYQTEQEAIANANEVKVILHPVPGFLGATERPIVVTSSPPGAAIFIDGNFEQKHTPETVRVFFPLGVSKKELRIEKTGFMPEKRTISREDTGIHIVLQPIR
jgi:hypothetical protein